MLANCHVLDISYASPKRRFFFFPNEFPLIKTGRNQEDSNMDKSKKNNKKKVIVNKKTPREKKKKETSWIFQIPKTMNHLSCFIQSVVSSVATYMSYTKKK